MANFPSFICRYFAEHDKATALQVLHDSLQPKHRSDPSDGPFEWFLLYMLSYLYLKKYP